MSGAGKIQQFAQNLRAGIPLFRKKGEPAAEQPSGGQPSADQTTIEKPEKASPKGIKEHYHHHCLKLTFHIHKKTGIPVDVHARFLASRAMDLAGTLSNDGGHMFTIHGGARMTAESFSDAIHHIKNPEVSIKKKAAKGVVALGSLMSMASSGPNIPLLSAASMAVNALGDVLDIAVDKIEEKQLARAQRKAEQAESAEQAE